MEITTINFARRTKLFSLSIHLHFQSENHNMYLYCEAPSERSTRANSKRGLPIPSFRLNTHVSRQNISQREYEEK